MQRVYRCFISCNQKKEDDYEMVLHSDDNNSRFYEENSEEDIANQNYCSDNLSDEPKDYFGCSNTICFCGFCICVPLFTLSGLFGGCSVAHYIQTYLIEVY